MFDMFVATEHDRTRGSRKHTAFLALEVGLHVMNIRIIQSFDMYFLMMI